MNSTPGHATSWTARCFRTGRGERTRKLYSGKHKTTGMNVQVACTITGCLAWISDPIPGRRHDNHCLGQSGVLFPVSPRNWLGDKGYVGNGMITPFKKPEGGELQDWQKEFNKQVDKIRYVIEQVIANFKTWRIMHTDYRRPLATFPETISAGADDPDLLAAVPSPRAAPGQPGHAHRAGITRGSLPPRNGRSVPGPRSAAGTLCPATRTQARSVIWPSADAADLVDAFLEDVKGVVAAGSFVP